MTVFVDVVGRGPNLTMLHGWGLNGAVWDGIRESLAEHYTLHIVDLPGHGHSRGIATTTLTAMTDAVATAIPGHSHLLGWSLGGLVAQDLARRYAERIDKLMLVATTPCFLQCDNWQHALLPAVLADFGARLSDNYAATIKRFLALQVLNQPNARASVTVLQNAVTSRGSTDHAALKTGLEILRTTDLRGQIADVAQPALVLHGDHDALTPEPVGRWLTATLPNARYVMMPHAAHAPFLSHRDAFLHELDTFLTA